MNKILVIPIIAVILFLIDLYVFQALRTIYKETSSRKRKVAYIFFWIITVITLIGLFLYHFVNPDILGRNFRSFIMVWIFMNYFSKLFAVIFLFFDDLLRLGKLIIRLFISLKPKAAEDSDKASVGKSITRAEFLAKSSLIAAGIPLAAMTYGIAVGAHDYRIRRATIFLPNLPRGFDGIRIGQISDIHSGSFFSRTAVRGGVGMLQREKPDIIFFTGDIVNNTAEELKEYVPVFGKITAPMGVYSTLGNHDYGEYVPWPSEIAKKKNFEKLKKAHKEMGWNLLMNENRIFGKEGESIAVLGVENWGGGNFPKYGKLDKAYAGTENAAVKLLLSHDPSHWDLQVRPEYPDIDVMFAGHTHGFQFGVELGDIKWSPSQYVYKQWAGLYQEENQYLYVNRGFGYLGFPGRVGIPPEITIIELKRA